jgi:hypothetical protein
MREECLLKEERERGREVKGGAMGSVAECAHWLALVLSGAWAMACELLFSRDLSAEWSCERVSKTMDWQQREGCSMKRLYRQKERRQETLVDKLYNYEIAFIT